MNATLTTLLRSARTAAGRSLSVTGAGAPAARDFNSFAYLNLAGQPRGNYMLDSLCAAGFRPSVVIEEDSTLAAKGAASLANELAKVSDRFPLPRSLDDIASEHGLDVKTVKNHNNKRCEEILKEAAPDLIILGDCRIIKPHIMGLSEGGVVNVHPGYLPDVKGNNPYIWSIVHDLPQGCTVHFIDENVDEGPIIHKARLHCDWQREGFTLQELLVEINNLCGSLLVESAQMLHDSSVVLEAQPPCNPEDTFKLCPPDVKAAAVAKLESGQFFGNAIDTESDTESLAQTKAA